MKKILSLFSLLVLFSSVSFSQTTIFTETMGSVGGTTTIAAHESANGFDNDAYTMTQGNATDPADVRVTSASTGYTGASGAGNIFFTATLERGFAIEGIDATGSFGDFTLTFGYRKENASANANFAVEFSIDNGATWTPVTVTGLPLAGAATAWYLLSATLPSSAAVNNLRIQWKRSAVAPVSMRIDDVILVGNPSVAAPTKLAITSISPASPTINTNFNVTIQSQDAGNIAQSVSANTDVTLSVATGTGALSGTTSGTINAGTNQTILSVSYDVAESGVSLTATRTSGDVLTPGTSSTFSVANPATQLVYVGIPTSGLVGVNLLTFNVEARRSDNTLDPTYVGDATIALTTGPGNLTGTTTKSFVSGVATFNDLQLDANGGYTLTVSSGSLTSATSGTITITTIPELRVFDGFVTPASGALNGNGWTTHSGTTNQIQIVTGGSLSYPNFAFSTGNRTRITSSNSEDINKALIAPISSGVGYFSALINVLNTTGLTIGGDYFLHFGQTSGASVTNFPGRLHIKTGSIGNTYQLGIVNQSGAGSTVSYEAVDLPINTTVLVVVKHDLTTNTSSLWINPSSASFGGVEPTPNLINATGTNTSTGIASLCIRQGSAATGNVEIDEIRVGTTWESVTPFASESLTVNNAFVNFPLTGVTLDAVGAGDLGQVTISNFTGPDGIVTFSGNTGIASRWRVTPVNQPTGNVTVTLTWLGIHDNGKNLSSLVMYKSTDNGANWFPISATFDGATNPRSATFVVDSFSDFTVSDADNPLPVELSGFTGRNIPTGVELRWNTITETDNAGFDVRRTELGGTEEWLTIASYRQISSLVGKGTTSQAHSYAYSDAGVEVGKSYKYQLRSTDLNGTVHDYPQSVVVEVRTLTPKTYTYKLEQNYPNPFNPTTRIVYQVAATSNVKLEVFDMLGRKVATLVDARKEAGEYPVLFNASELSSGIYFYRLQTDKFSQTRKLIVVK